MIAQLIDVTGGGLILHIQEADVKAFKELVFRGANLWPDAPRVIKELADMLTDGKVLQDYTSEKKMTDNSHVPDSVRFTKDENKKSVHYGNCANCGKHYNEHATWAGVSFCSNKSMSPFQPIQRTQS